MDCEKKALGYLLLFGNWVENVWNWVKWAGFNGEIYMYHEGLLP